MFPSVDRNAQVKRQTRHRRSVFWQVFHFLHLLSGGTYEAPRVHRQFFHWFFFKVSLYSSALKYQVYFSILSWVLFSAMERHLIKVSKVSPYTLFSLMISRCKSAHPFRMSVTIYSQDLFPFLLQVSLW